MPPGNYTVKLSAGGTELSQPLMVKKDPNSSGSESDIQAQFAPGVRANAGQQSAKDQR